MKLTANQVREAIYICSTYASYDGCTLHASGIRLQAITDVLNTTLGSETCEVNGTNFWEWEWSDFTAYYEHELSCGHVANTMEPEPPNFCPECGCKIRKAVKQ